MTTNLVQIIKNKIQHSEFDYIALTGALSGYANPRNQISKLIRNGDIVRVKKAFMYSGQKEATISMTPKKERLNLKHLWDGLFTTTSKHPNTSLA